MEEAQVIARSRAWIASMVIGLNLCPFAERVFRGEKIRYIVTETHSPRDLLAVLDQELTTLIGLSIDQVETTLIIHPHTLTDFLEYNDFLDDCDALLRDLRLHGIVQIASFHPEYQFAGTKPHDVENYTNRSPYPMLHLLREESINRVASDDADLEAIPERNIKTMRRLGREKVLEMVRSSQQAAENKRTEPPSPG